MKRASSSAFTALLPILLVSGACSLVYQVVWLRLLRLVFGASTEASAAVVAVFMAGLGVGGWWFGRRTRDLDRPLRLYARLEAGIAITAAATPLLVAGVRAAYMGLGGSSTLGLATTPVRLLSTVLVLGLPTLLMGGTLPVAVHAAERHEDIGRRRVAWLYGTNTLGAVAGALAANFLLVERLGVSRSLWLAAACNLLLAVVAFRLARAFDGDPSGAAAETPVAAARSTASLLPRRTLLAVAALVGFVFFVMELVWYRMLAPILGGSTYTMGLVLAVALVGIGGGGLLYALAHGDRRPTVAALAITCGLEALVLAVPFALGDLLALLTIFLRDLSAFGFGGLVTSWAMITAVVVLPSALVAGYQFPLLVALLGVGDEGAGDDVGTAYAWNTAGAIAGSLAGGFGLMPLLGAPTVWRWSVALLVLTGLWLAWTARAPRLDRAPRRRPRPVPAVGLAVAALLAACVPDGPTSFWRHVPIGAGRVKTAELETPNAWTNYRRDIAWATRYEADGRETAISLQVFDDPALLVNGKSDGSGRGDASTTVMSGLIGASLHPDPRDALVIGLGLGATAGFFTTVDSIERVDIVELEPAVVEVARRVGPLGFDVLDAPETVLHLGDGREMVMTSDRQWDLIFSEPSNPYRAGVADLFSRDLYRAAKHRLRPGGIFLQWLQAYEIDPPMMSAIYASISDAFPHVETWQASHADLLLVASAEPLDHDPRRLAEVLGRPSFERALRRVVQLSGLPGLYAGYVGGPELAASLSAESPPSTDDRPLIEFGFARTLGRQRWLPIADLLRLAEALGVDRPPGLDDATWRATVEGRRLRHVRGTAFALDADASPLAAARAASEQGALGSAGELWRATEPPRTHGDLLFAAEAAAETGAPIARQWIDAVAASDPVAALALDARLAWRTGDREAAIESLVASFEGLRSDAWSDLDIGRRALDLAAELGEDERIATRLHAALAEPFAGSLLDRQRTIVRTFLLARALDFAEQCRDFFATQEPHVLWIRPVLEARLDCYQRHDAPLLGRAERELFRFLVQRPEEFVLPPVDAVADAS